MSANAREPLQIGELVVAAFDWAARYSADPKEVSRLARTVVMHVLRREPAMFSMTARPLSFELKEMMRHLD